MGPTVLTALGCASNLETRRNKEQQQQKQKQMPDLCPVHPRKPGCSLSAYILKPPTEASTSQEPGFLMNYLQIKDKGTMLPKLDNSSSTKTSQLPGI